MTHASATGITCGPVASLKAVWVAHCRDMPGCLLATGLEAVLRRWTNTFCLPSPGAVWEEIQPELARMRRDLAKMENAQRLTQADAFDPADRAPSTETEAMLEKTRAILRAAGAGSRRAA